MRISQKVARFVVPATWGSPPRRRQPPATAAQLDFFALIDGGAAEAPGATAVRRVPPVTGPVSAA